MDTEAMGQIERIGRVEGYIQSELSTPFARPSLTASHILYVGKKGIDMRT
jgi:hypothetical protein